jgi:ferric-dicitrate binding protein FerR (iron transport regulator)
MKACNRVDEYLDDRLGPGESAAFEEHLEQCSECQTMIEGWRELQRVLYRGTVEAEPDIPQHPGEVARLVARARERRIPAVARYGRAVGLAAAAAAAALAFVLIVDYVDPLGSEPAEQPAPMQSVGRALEAPADGPLLTVIGTDRIGLGPGSRVIVVEAIAGQTRLRLDRGLVACAVQSREDGAEFVVEAGDRTVRVTGTMFLVELIPGGGLGVQVAEGTVVVGSPGEDHGTVTAGKSLTISRSGQVRIADASPTLLSRLDALFDESPRAGEPVALVESEPEDLASDEVGDVEPAAAASATEAPSAAAGSGGPATVPEPGSLADWRAWIIQGRHAEAEHAISGYLARHPADTAAWSLLADCRRKAGRWSAAVEAYRKVVDLAPATEANRARFMAGTILGDRLGSHAAAASLFADYLTSTGHRPLAAEAMLRRAGCLRALGRAGEAIGLLEDLIARHGGSSAAIKARRQLEEIRAQAEGNATPGE